MMARVTELGVWLHDEQVGRLTSPQVGRIRLSYTKAVREAYPLNTTLLSCSLPVRTGSQDAWPFATGLLPEGQQLQAMAALAGLPTHDVLGLLARFGRDVAGAVTLSTEAPLLRNATVEPYTADQLATTVDELTEHPLGLYDDSELSIAGLQDKMLLVSLPDGRWGRPVHGYPSTHLLKLDDRRHPGLVEAEHTCLELAAAAGLPAASSQLLTFGHLTCLVVKRFDRATDKRGTVTRVHQEDACQALGIDPERNNRFAKYQAQGGPSLVDIAALLDQHAGENMLLALLDQLAFTVVIGNADAHGKNLSFLHPKPGELELAPLYDTVPTVLWPRLRTEAAMAIGGCTQLLAVTQQDLVKEGMSWGLGRRAVTERLQRTLARLDEVALQLKGTNSIGDRALDSATQRVRQLS